MKSYYFLFIIFSLFTTLLLTGCKEKDLRKLLNEGDPIPGIVSNIKVENLHGAAKITYDLPQDENLLYIKATYNIKPGVEREAESSYYNGSILLDGFSSSKQYKVKLYSVSRGGSVSDAVDVSVHPLEPVYKMVFESIKLSPIFGGIRINYNNKYKSNLVIVLLKKDSITQVFAPLHTFYIKEDSGALLTRGLESKKAVFKYYVRDQFQNISDTGSAAIKPLFEEILDKSKFSIARLPGDSWKALYGDLPQVWDGILITHKPISSFTSEVKPLPIWFTINLGQEARLSRFTVTPRPHYAAYNRAYPKVFELWGSQSPNPNGKFDSTWFKYGTFITTTPDGGPPTTEVIENPVTQNFNIPNGDQFPPVKYIRFKSLESWGGFDQLQIAEITLYGQIK